MSIVIRTCSRMLVLLTLAGVACAGPAPRSGDSAGSGASRLADTARFAQLEREARALASTTGCADAGACRTAPVGSRGCGGLGRRQSH